MKNYSPKTVKLFLLEGDPTSAKKVQLSNWSGIAFVIPRNKLEIIKRTGDGSPFLFTIFKTLYLQSFQTPFRNALKTHGECL